MPRWFFPIPSLRAQSIGFFLFHFSPMWTVESVEQRTQCNRYNRGPTDVWWPVHYSSPLSPLHIVQCSRVLAHISPTISIAHVRHGRTPAPLIPPPLSPEPSLSPSRNIDSRFDSPVVFTIKRPIIPPSERMV